MAHWAVIIPADRWTDERLYHHDTFMVPGGVGAVDAGEEVLVVADGAVVALTRAVKTDGDDLVLEYLRRSFDEPVSAEALDLADDPDAALLPVDPKVFERVRVALGADPAVAGRRTWLVSVALPIEAETPADAVRQFWTHVGEMGPAELPTYVWPSGDELAMQAFVLGVEANQDPEEED